MRNRMKMKKCFAIFLIINLLFCNLAYANLSIDNLTDRMSKKNTLICVGLDPDPQKFPTEILNLHGLDIEEKTLLFLQNIVDITADHVCAYKIQKAFFDTYNNGHKLLQDTIDYIHTKHPEIPVFVDCKIGDTDNTMQAYMHNLFDILKADGVVINPYMGDDVFEPFQKDPRKVGIVLVQTSNPNAKIVQEVELMHGKPFWEYMLSLTVNRWNTNRNLIPVLSSNSESVDFKRVRKVIPQDMPILLAGVGIQGGNPQVVKDLLNDKGTGVFVNSSRGILYPYEQNNLKWKKAVLEEVLALKKTINKMRN